MLHKLKSQRGETLVETMASIVIAALSVALLFTCVVTSVRLDQAAKQMDEAYYKALTLAETQTAGEDGEYPVKSGEVKIVNGAAEKVLNILLYGGEGMYAYAKGAGP